jgi:hypothetical protein
MNNNHRVGARHALPTFNLCSVEARYIVPEINTHNRLRANCIRPINIPSRSVGLPPDDINLSNARAFNLYVGKYCV